MNTDSDTYAPSGPSRRLRFSLLALLLFITLVAVVLAWLFQPTQSVAVALFRISAQPPLLIAGSQPRFNPREFEILKETQIALLRSHFVLERAVRNPTIAGLPMVSSRDDPVAWLQRNLEVDFPEQSEVLSIRLRGPEAAADDLAKIIDAVANAYQEEVIWAERQRRLTERDIKTRAMERLRSDIENTMRSLQAASSDGDNQADLDAMLKQAELDILVDLWRELARDVKRDYIERNVPDRIQQLQPAVITRE